MSFTAGFAVGLVVGARICRHRPSQVPPAPRPRPVHPSLIKVPGDFGIYERAARPRPIFQSPMKRGS